MIKENGERDMCQGSSLPQMQLWFLECSQGQETGLLGTSSGTSPQPNKALGEGGAGEDMIPISLSSTLVIKTESDFLHQDCCPNKIGCDSRHPAPPPPPIGTRLLRSCHLPQLEFKA